MAKMTDERLEKIGHWLGVRQAREAWKYRPRSTLSEYYAHCWDLLTEVRRLRRYEDVLCKWAMSGLPDDLKRTCQAAGGPWHAIAWEVINHLQDVVDSPPEEKLASPAEHKLDAIRRVLDG